MTKETGWQRKQPKKRKGEKSVGKPGKRKSQRRGTHTTKRIKSLDQLLMTGRKQTKPKKAILKKRYYY